MKVTAVAIAMLIVLGCFVWVMVDAAMPSNALLTRGRLQKLQEAITRQVETTGDIPLGLSHLKMPSGEAAPVEDYWKRPLGYQISREGTGFAIRLSSLGKDGQAGGSGESKDIELRFAVTAPQSTATRASTGPTTEPATMP